MTDSLFFAYLLITLRLNNAVIIRTQPSTRNRKPFKLIYTEEYSDKEEAMKREAFFKSGKGREYLKEMNIF